MNINLPSTLDNSITDMSNEVGAVSAIAREQAEIQAAIVSARRFPRDELAAYARVMRSMETHSMAIKSEYQFTRGKNRISGPSAPLAREVARCWGNLRYGVRVVSIDEENIHIKGYAYDIETNTYQESEDKFRKLVQRKNKEGVTLWQKPDERDTRELINRRGAICERNAILKLLPPGMVEDALHQARKTCIKAASGDLKHSRDETVRKLVSAFDTLGVSTEMLSSRLGYEIGRLTEDDLVTLRAIYQSILDGHSSRDEHFETGKRVESEGAASINSALTEAANKVTTDGPNISGPYGSQEGRGGGADSPLAKAQRRAEKMKLESSGNDTKTHN